MHIYLLVTASISQHTVNPKLITFRFYRPSSSKKALTKLELRVTVRAVIKSGSRRLHAENSLLDRLPGVWDQGQQFPSVLSYRSGWCRSDSLSAQCQKLTIFEDITNPAHMYHIYLRPYILHYRQCRAVLGDVILELWKSVPTGLPQQESGPVEPGRTSFGIIPLGISIGTLDC